MKSTAWLYCTAGLSALQFTLAVYYGANAAPWWYAISIFLGVYIYNRGFQLALRARLLEMVREKSMAAFRRRF